MKVIFSPHVFLPNTQRPLNERLRISSQKCWSIKKKEKEVQTQPKWWEDLKFGVAFIFYTLNTNQHTISGWQNFDATENRKESWNWNILRYSKTIRVLVLMIYLKKSPSNREPFLFQINRILCLPEHFPKYSS